MPNHYCNSEANGTVALCLNGGKFAKIFFFAHHDNVATQYCRKNRLGKVKIVKYLSPDPFDVVSSVKLMFSPEEKSRPKLGSWGNSAACTPTSQREEIKPILTYLANPRYLITLLILVAVAPFLSGCFTRICKLRKTMTAPLLKQTKRARLELIKTKSRLRQQDIARSKS